MCYFYLHLSLLLLFDVYVLKRVALKLPMFQFPFRTVKTFKMLKIRDEFLSVSARVQPNDAKKYFLHGQDLTITHMSSNNWGPKSSFYPFKTQNSCRLQTRIRAFALMWIFMAQVTWWDDGKPML